MTTTTRKLKDIEKFRTAGGQADSLDAQVKINKNLTAFKEYEDNEAFIDEYTN